MFVGDRYARLQQAAAVLAEDPAVRDALFPFNSAGLPCFVACVSERRLLDQLSDEHADAVTMLLLVDFHFGPQRLLERIGALLAEPVDNGPIMPRNWRLASSLATVLSLAIDVQTWRPEVPS